MSCAVITINYEMAAPAGYDPAKSCFKGRRVFQFRHGAKGYLGHDFMDHDYEQAGRYAGYG